MAQSLRERRARLAFATMLVLVTSAPQAAIISVSGDAFIDSFPSGLDLHEFRAENELARVIDEKLGIFATTDAISTFAGPDIDNLFVDSHMIHYDPIGQVSTSVFGRVTFNSLILAVYTSADALRETDSIFGLDSVSYPTTIGVRGIDSQDGLVISDNWIEFRLTTARIDSFRVITQSLQPFPVPEPGTLALLGIGLVGMGLARRRKQT